MVYLNHTFLSFFFFFSWVSYRYFPTVFWHWIFSRELWCQLIFLSLISTFFFCLVAENIFYNYFARFFVSRLTILSQFYLKHGIPFEDVVSTLLSFFLNLSFYFLLKKFYPACSLLFLLWYNFYHLLIVVLCSFFWLKKSFFLPFLSWVLQCLFHFLLLPVCLSLSSFFFSFFLFVVNFVIHWNETAMGLHVFPIPSPPPPSLSTRSL